MIKARSIHAAILIVCAGLFSAGSAFGDSLENDLKVAYESWDAAFNKADTKAIANFYTEDAVLLPSSHEVIKGPAAVEKFFAAVFATGASGHRLELLEAHGEGNLVYGAAKWSANGKDANGKDQPWGGLAAHIFARQPDGSLKIKLHTFN